MSQKVAAIFQKFWFMAVILAIIFPITYLASIFRPIAAAISCYFLTGLILFAAFWKLRMNKKYPEEKTSWLGFYLFGFMLIAIMIGVSVQEKKLLPYILLSALVLIALIVPLFINVCRSKSKQNQITEQQNS